MKTRAAVLYQLNEPLRLVELTLPALQAGQVLVAMAYSGICHSQLNEIRGKRGPDRFLPHTLGHEGSGHVLDVGPGVTKVKPGDAVVLTWIKGKGAEVPSVQYSGPDGPVNSGAISTFLDRTIVSENRLIRIPPALPLREAALLGCALPTGAGTVLNGLQVRPGSSLAVFGAGGVGLSAILAARLVNAAPLIAIDVVDHKLEQARRLGASHCIHALRQDPVTALMELTGGRGVDFAVEAAGRPETMEAAIASVRAGGGHVSLAGNLPAGARIELDPFDLIRGKQVTGSWGGDTDPDRDLPRYATLFAAGALPLAELITHTYPLEEINQAFSDLEASLVGRALVVNQGKERP